nr:class I adenylate-forming enzyme family protein [uncultured Noviherbaspirillum sp.]
MLNQTDAGAVPRRIHHAFLPWAASQPDAIALTDDLLTLRYGELPAAVDAVAAQMSATGVRAGDRVLLVAENAVALAVCIMAISQLDAWSATVNARLSAREIDNFLEHSGARRALYFGTVSPAARAHAEARGAERQLWPVIGEIYLGALNTGAEPEPVFADPTSQTAVMVYTSGTTGAPKAVMLSHANLLFIGSNNRLLRKLGPGDTVYGVLPLSHVYGLSALLVASLISGAALLLAPRFTEQALAHALAMRGITVMHGAPPMYAKLLAWSEQTGTPLPAPHLRVAQSGGAPLTAALKSAFEKTFGVVLQNGYGMTEAAPSICQTRMESPRADCSVGPAIPGIEVRLQGAELDEAGVGEIQVRGPNVMLGYYRAPELTAETLTDDGWLRTGDLAQVDADGAYHVVGRSKELIIRSGFNVYPVEVEQVLNAHPDVVQSAVVGRAVEGNEEVVAFVETTQDAAVTVDALRAYLKDRLSPYKVPTQIIIMQQLPAAPTGKILKKELQRIATAGN